MGFCSFNPRSRGGSDAISGNLANLYLGFNPRSRGGSDSLELLELFLRIEFQSTLPRGERLCVP